MGFSSREGGVRGGERGRGSVVMMLVVVRRRRRVGSFEVRGGELRGVGGWREGVRRVGAGR